MRNELETLQRAATAAAAAFEANGPEDVDVWRRVVLAVREADARAGQATRALQGRPSAGRAARADDYLATFAAQWADVVLHPRTGQLDPDKVARELHDYSHVLHEVPRVYAHVTGDQMSKPGYYAADVIALADEHYDRIAREHGLERAAEALREVVDEWQVLADGDPSMERILEDISERIEALESPVSAA